jgi:hypothetical protein
VRGARIGARSGEIAERRLVLLVDERIEDLALALEVEVDGALRQVRAFRDVLDSRREVARSMKTARAARRIWARRSASG